MKWKGGFVMLTGCRQFSGWGWRIEPGWLFSCPERWANLRHNEGIKIKARLTLTSTRSNGESDSSEPPRKLRHNWRKSRAGYIFNFVWQTPNKTKQNKTSVFPNKTKTTTASFVWSNLKNALGTPTNYLLPSRCSKTCWRHMGAERVRQSHTSHICWIVRGRRCWCWSCRAAHLQSDAQ